MIKSIKHFSNASYDNILKKIAKNKYAIYLLKKLQKISFLCIYMIELYIELNMLLF